MTHTNSHHDYRPVPSLDDSVFPRPVDARVVVVGAGAYGTAMAYNLVGGRQEEARVRDVTILTRRPEVARAINDEHRNPTPGLRRELSDLNLLGISASADPKIISEADYVVVAVPSTAIEQLVPSLEGLPKQTVIASTVKSILPGNSDRGAQTPIGFLRESLGKRSRSLAFLGGPGFAHDLVQGGSVKRLVAASEDWRVGSAVAELFTAGELVVKSHNDPIGAEVGCAMKNFGALVMGVANELGFDERTKARIFHEVYLELLEVIQIACSSQRIEIGRSNAVHADLFLTATGASRNVAMGEALVKHAGAYSDARELARNLGLTAEGLNAAEGALALTKVKGRSLIFVEAMAEILQGKDPKAVMDRSVDAINSARDARRDPNWDPDSSKQRLQNDLLSIFPLVRGILEGMQAAPQERGIIFNLAMRELRRAAKLFGGSFQKDVLWGSAHEQLFRVFNSPVDSMQCASKNLFDLGRVVGMGVSALDLPPGFYQSLEAVGVRVVEMLGLQAQQNDVLQSRGRERVSLPFVEVLSAIISGGHVARHALRELMRDDYNPREHRPKSLRSMSAPIEPPSVGLSQQEE